jgi:hypothetical protein
VSNTRDTDDAVVTPPIKDTTNNNVVRLPVQHAQPELQPETEAEPNTTSGDADDLDDDEIDDDLDKEANAYKEDYRRKTLPWREPVDGLALLDDLTTTFQRFMVLPGPARLAWDSGHRRRASSTRSKRSMS